MDDFHPHNFWPEAMVELLRFPTPPAPPMKHEGLPPPKRAGTGKPSTYKPCPNNPPRCGSKRKRQWK